MHHACPLGDERQLTSPLFLSFLFFSFPFPFFLPFVKNGVMVPKTDKGAAAASSDPRAALFLAMGLTEGKVQDTLRNKDLSQEIDTAIKLVRWPFVPSPLFLFFLFFLRVCVFVCLCFPRHFPFFFSADW
jgi:hypothetical protein